MKLGVVILNYRTAQLTINCLNTVASAVEAMRDLRVVVADNASGDGSVERIGAAIHEGGWSGWAEVVPLPRNGGYAYGNNRGIDYLLGLPDPPELVMLLNPDTLVRPEAIPGVVAYMREHPHVGICGTGLEGGDGQPEASSHRFPTPLGELVRGSRLGVLARRFRDHVHHMSNQSQPHECDWVSGASMVIRREALDGIGLMDEGYFLYFDEVDYCARAKRRGWSVWCVPSLKVVHLEGQSTGIRAPRKRRGRYWYDSRRRFFVKNYGLGGLVAADAFWAGGRASFAIRRCLGLARREANDPKWFTLDLLAGDLLAICRGEVAGSPRERGSNQGAVRLTPDSIGELQKGRPIA